MSLDQYDFNNSMRMETQKMKNGEPSLVAAIPKNLRDVKVEQNAYLDINHAPEGGYDSQDSNIPQQAQQSFNDVQIFESANNEARSSLHNQSNG